MYHSYAEPSIAANASVPPVDSTGQYYVFDYYCFGSDEQAIKIAAYSKDKNFAKKFKTVVYHIGNAQGSASSSVVKQRVLEGSSVRVLWGDIFTSESMF